MQIFVHPRYILISDFVWGERDALFFFKELCKKKNIDIIEHMSFFHSEFADIVMIYINHDIYAIKLVNEKANEKREQGGMCNGILKIRLALELNRVASIFKNL